MNIDDLSLPGVEETGGENAHEAGAGDKLDVVVAKRSVDLGVEVGPGGETLVVDCQGSDIGFTGEREAGGVRTVGDDERDVGRIGGIARRGQQRLQVRAAA